MTRSAIILPEKSRSENREGERMFQIRLAGLNIRVFNRYEFSRTRCQDYLADFERADLEVSVSPAQIEKEKAEALCPCSDDYAEFICIYREIALRLPQFDAFVFHAAVVAVDGEAYAFTAPSGTGKSTHIRFWLSEFADKGAKVVNGDKPIFRLENGIFTAYGTPWCGKEDWGENTCAPLHAICFLTRGAENKISRIGDEESVSRIFHQVIMPKDPEIMDRFLSLLDSLISSVPAYLLECTISTMAAQVAYNGMKGESHDSE